MQCGAKCYIVEVELNGEKKSVPVTARSPIQARKAVRLQYEELVKIISVKSENQWNDKGTFCNMFFSINDL